jgi:hypothetical protein
MNTVRLGDGYYRNYDESVTPIVIGKDLAEREQHVALHNMPEPGEPGSFQEACRDAFIQASGGHIVEVGHHIAARRVVGLMHELQRDGFKIIRVDEQENISRVELMPD